jgi:hypothetical protein
MDYADVAVPLGSAWSSPFATSQGTPAEVDGLDPATAVTSRPLADRELDSGRFDGIALGWTVPQKRVVHGAPTLAARIGAPGLTGPMAAAPMAVALMAAVLEVTD